MAQVTVYPTGVVAGLVVGLLRCTQSDNLNDQADYGTQLTYYLNNLGPQDADFKKTVSAFQTFLTGTAGQQQLMNAALAANAALLTAMANATDATGAALWSDCRWIEYQDIFDILS